MARLNYPAAEILTHLLELAAVNAGFELRGIRGWASASFLVEITGIWGASGLLKTQARTGRVFQEDVRAPGESRAAHVYRITQRGIDTLAAIAGTWPADVRNPLPCGDAGVLLRDGVLSALHGLRAAGEADGRSGAGQDPGGQAWYSSRDLTRMLDREDEAAGRAPRWFMSEDLAWLVARGFAEHLVVGKTHRYRITPIGAALRPLDWKAPG